jgi:hypothetical protein
MLGGEFLSHGSQQEARVKVVDPKFPGLQGSNENLTSAPPRTRAKCTIGTNEPPISQRIGLVRAIWVATYSLSLTPLARIACWRGRSTAGPIHWRTPGIVNLRNDRSLDIRDTGFGALVKRQ